MKTFFLCLISFLSFHLNAQDVTITNETLVVDAMGIGKCYVEVLEPIVFRKGNNSSTAGQFSIILKNNNTNLHLIRQLQVGRAFKLSYVSFHSNRSFVVSDETVHSIQIDMRDMRAERFEIGQLYDNSEGKLRLYCVKDTEVLDI